MEARKQNKSLEEMVSNLVTREELQHKGYKKNKHYMYRIIHHQEIRFIHVHDELYAFSGVYNRRRYLRDE